MGSRKRTWVDRFCDAGRGVAVAARTQPSFGVHLLVAALVIVCGVVLQVSRLESCLLVLCIGSVLAAETMNSAVEVLAKVVSPQRHTDIGRCLDMAAGAVLLTAIAAATVGLTIFIPRLITLLSSFS